LPPLWSSDRKAPVRKAKAFLEADEQVDIGSNIVLDKDKEIERLRIAVCPQFTCAASVLACSVNHCAIGKYISQSFARCHLE
jgi:hypothetical protein